MFSEYKLERHKPMYIYESIIVTYPAELAFTGQVVPKLAKVFNNRTQCLAFDHECHGLDARNN